LPQDGKAPSADDPIVRRQQGDVAGRLAKARTVRPLKVQGFENSVAAHSTAA